MIIHDSNAKTVFAAIDSIMAANSDLTAAHAAALRELLPLLDVLDGSSTASQGSLVGIVARLNSHLPELLMRLMKSHVAAERARFVALFADEGKGALAWNDTVACLAFDAMHGTVIRDLESIVSACTSGAIVNASGVRVPGTPAQVIEHIAPAWLRVKRVLGTCLSAHPDIAGLVRDPQAA